jgi:hypothetical protein
VDALLAALSLLTPPGLRPALGAEPDVPPGWTARNIEPVSYAKLAGPRTFKLGLKRAADGWFLFVGEGGGGVREGMGVRVLDVTDPARPRSVAHIPVENGDGQITLHGDLLIAGRQLPFPPPAAGGSIEYPFKGTAATPTALASFYDISDPTQPRKLGDWTTAGWGTHRNGYPGGRYAFMSAWVAGYRGQSVLVILRCRRSRAAEGSRALVDAGPGGKRARDTSTGWLSRPARVERRRSHAHTGVHTGSDQPGQLRRGASAPGRSARLRPVTSRRHPGDPHGGIAGGVACCT